tara:strand:- start:929 stop:1258 length:330 start_codon:yes stop_codon:yes gene_type:complete
MTFNVNLDKTLQTIGQHPNLRRRRPLLWAKHRGGIDESGPNVAGDQKFHAPVAVKGAHGLKGTKSSVSSSRSADAHDHPTGTGFHGVAQQLTDAGGGRVKRSVLVRSAS